MLVKKGDYRIIADTRDSEQGSESGEKKSSQGNPSISKVAQELKEVPKVGGEKPGQATTSDLAGQQIKAKVEKMQASGKKFYKGSLKKVKTDWKDLAKKAVSRGQIPEKFKKLITQLTKEIPSVDWKKELKRFFDRAFTKFKEVMPKRRFASQGLYVRGLKRGGEETLKTIVCAVDTSGSISRDQSRTFVTEVMHLCKMFNADTTYIIYCSDDIDGIDTIKKGKDPDFSKWGTTGGNSKGFIPPFEWVQKNNIKPSVFIYFTDTGGEMPNPKDFGIQKYANRVIWFICSPKIYTMPTFGKIIFTPLKFMGLSGKK